MERQVPIRRDVVLIAVVEDWRWRCQWRVERRSEGRGARYHLKL
jgi:hypothetical protein